MEYDEHMRMISLKDRLETAIAALTKIAESDPGPAYYIARSALDQIGVLVQKI